MPFTPIFSGAIAKQENNAMLNYTGSFIVK